jgi:accessory colonization factor AcfC
MTLHTVRVVFDTDDADALSNIKSQVVQLIASRAPSVTVQSATLAYGDGPLVDLIDLAETYQTAQAQAQTVDQEPQATAAEKQEESAADSLPTGREF